MAGDLHVVKLRLYQEKSVSEFLGHFVRPPWVELRAAENRAASTTAEGQDAIGTGQQDAALLKKIRAQIGLRPS